MLITKMVLVPALLSTMFCAVLLYFSAVSPYVIMSSSVARIYSTILGFVIVFRTSMAFSRFFEGVSHVQMLFSKWRDAFSSMMIFCECSIAIHAERGDRQTVEDLLLVKARFLHWFSMLSAFAVQELQDDDTAAEQMDEPLDWSSQESSANRLCMIPFPANRLAPQIEEPAPGSRLRQRRASGMGVLLQECGPQGLDGIGPMGKDVAFVPTPFASPDFVRNSFSDESGKVDFNGSLGVTYPSSGSGASKLSDEASAEQKRRAISFIGEVTMQEFHQLSIADDTVLTILKWIIMEVSHHTVTGKLLIGPPILSRVYQELSNGMLAFSLAKIKISTVPFPFPFAQVLSYALYAFYILCPFIILECLVEEDQSLEQVATPLFMNFLACVGYGACNEIAIELEEPFGFDTNDYPVHGQQNMIVRSMEDTYFATSPSDFSIESFSGGVQRVQQVPVDEVLPEPDPRPWTARVPPDPSR